MVTFYTGLTVFEKILFIVAFASSFLLVLQIILVLIGLGHGGDVGNGDVGSDFHGDFHGGDIHAGDFHGDVNGDLHTDVPHDTNTGTGAELSLFTIKGFIAFFSVGGWSALAVTQAGGHIILAVLVGIVAGFLAMYGVAYLYRLGFKLQDDGTIRLNTAIGEVAKVYLTIPSKGNGSGKIMMTLQERFIEAEAITNSNEPIKTDEMVRVMGCYENTLIVERLEK